MKRKVSVCAGIMAAVVAFSAGAEEAKVGGQAPETVPTAEAAPAAAEGKGAVAAAAPVEDAGTEQAMPAPPLVEAAVGGSVSAAAADTPAQTKPADAPAVAKAGAEAEEVRVPVSLSVLPGISTAGMHTGNVVNNVSIGLVATHAKRVDGAAIALGANWVEAGLTGAQLAVGANVARGPVTGGQFSVGGNVAGGDLSGGQFSVGANIVRGKLTGGQFSVGGNVAAGPVSGAQVGVGANVAAGSVLGAQLAVGANVASGPVRGLQASAGVNVAREVIGWQMSSGVSYAGHVAGGQISVINVGGQVDGAQVGLINVAGRVKGAQVGLLNVVREAQGESVGLLSFVGNGQAHLQVWGSDVAMANVGLKLGSRHLYTLLTAGFHPPMDGERRRYTLGMGFGGHIPMGRFFLDVDLVGSSLHSDKLFGDDSENNVLGQTRVMAGWQVARRFAVYGGVSANTLVTWDGGDRWEELGIGPEWRQVSDGGRTTVRTWPGLLAGVQL